MLSECGLGPNLIVDMKKSMPSADKIAKIADYFDVSVDYLLGRTDNPSGLAGSFTPQAGKLYNDISLLTPEKYELAVQFIEFLKIQSEKQKKEQQ